MPTSCGVMEVSWQPDGRDVVYDSFGDHLLRSNVPSCPNLFLGSCVDQTLNAHQLSATFGTLSSARVELFWRSFDLNTQNSDYNYLDIEGNDFMKTYDYCIESDCFTNSTNFFEKRDWSCPPPKATLACKDCSKEKKFIEKICPMWSGKWLDFGQPKTVLYHSTDAYRKVHSLSHRNMESLYSARPKRIPVDLKQKGLLYTRQDNIDELRGYQDFEPSANMCDLKKCVSVITCKTVLKHCIAVDKRSFKELNQIIFSGEKCDMANDQKPTQNNLYKSLLEKLFQQQISMSDIITDSMEFGIPTESNQEDDKEKKEEELRTGLTETSISYLKSAVTNLYLYPWNLTLCSASVAKCVYTSFVNNDTVEAFVVLKNTTISKVENSYRFIKHVLFEVNYTGYYTSTVNCVKSVQCINKQLFSAPDNLLSIFEDVTVNFTTALLKTGLYTTNYSVNTLGKITNCLTFNVPEILSNNTIISTLTGVLDSAINKSIDVLTYKPDFLTNTTAIKEHLRNSLKNNHKLTNLLLLEKQREAYEDIESLVRKEFLKDAHMGYKKYVDYNLDDSLAVKKIVRTDFTYPPALITAFHTWDRKDFSLTLELSAIAQQIKEASSLSEVFSYVNKLSYNDLRMLELNAIYEESRITETTSEDLQKAEKIRSVIRKFKILKYLKLQQEEPLSVLTLTSSLYNNTKTGQNFTVADLLNVTERLDIKYTKLMEYIDLNEQYVLTNIIENLYLSFTAGNKIERIIESFNKVTSTISEWLENPQLAISYLKKSHRVITATLYKNTFQLLNIAIMNNEIYFRGTAIGPAVSFLSETLIAFSETTKFSVIDLPEILSVVTVNGYSKIRGLFTNLSHVPPELDMSITTVGGLISYSSATLKNAANLFKLELMDTKWLSPLNSINKLVKEHYLIPVTSALSEPWQNGTYSQKTRQVLSDFLKLPSDAIYSLLSHTQPVNSLVTGFADHIMTFASLSYIAVDEMYPGSLDWLNYAEYWMNRNVLRILTDQPPDYLCYSQYGENCVGISTFSEYNPTILVNNSVEVPIKVAESISRELFTDTQIDQVATENVVMRFLSANSAPFGKVYSSNYTKGEIIFNLSSQSSIHQSLNTHYYFEYFSRISPWLERGYNPYFNHQMRELSAKYVFNQIAISGSFLKQSKHAETITSMQTLAAFQEQANITVSKPRVHVVTNDSAILFTFKNLVSNYENSAGYCGQVALLKLLQNKPYYRNHIHQLLTSFPRILTDSFSITPYMLASIGTVCYTMNAPSYYRQLKVCFILNLVKTRLLNQKSKLNTFSKQSD